MDLQFDEIKLDNPGVLKTRIPLTVFNEVSRDIETQLNASPKSYSKDLAGHLEEEYVYNMCSSLKTCLSLMYEEYSRKFGYKVGQNYDVDTTSWVNIQKKGEYNPLHFHYQQISWVLWINIPYLLEDELNQCNVQNSNSRVASMFQFVYNKLDGGIEQYSIPVDKSWEGVMIMFPAYLKHQVYPFSTVDDVRISVAGNIAVGS